MYTRLTYIENRKTLADSGEYVTDVNVRDPITAIDIEFRAVNGASGNKANLVADCVELVEILDGSTVLASVTGKDLAIDTFYRLKTLPYWLVAEIPSLTQNAFFRLLFGRWYGDTSFSFAPSKFNNPQIRIKWNLANVRAVGSTGFVSGSMMFSAIAHVMEGVGDPTGYMSLKQHYSFTTSASGTEYIELPTDADLVRLYLRSHESGVGQLSGISNVKIQGDQGKNVLVDMRSSDFKRVCAGEFPVLVYKHHAYIKDNDTFYVIPKQDETVNLSPESSDTVIAYQNYGIGEGAVRVLTGGAGASSELNAYGIVTGYLPFGGVAYQFGSIDEPDKWLPAGSYKSLRLELTQNNAGASCYVVVLQAKAY